MTATMRSDQTPKKVRGCPFDKLTLSPLDFPKMIFLEKRQSPAICDFFSYFCHFSGVIGISLLQKKLLTSAYNQ